jgi:hypothetical protein
MALGLLVLVLAVTGVAADGTRALLFRRSLQAAADAASTGGAAAIDVQTYYRSGGSEVVLDPASARQAAGSLLAARGPLADAASIEADAARVRVVLRAEMPTLFLRLVGVSSVPVAAEAAAEPIPGPPG